MFKVCLVLACVFFVVARGSGTEVPQQIVSDADEVRLLKSNTLRIPVAGCITGSFERAGAILQSSNLLEKVQQAYAAQLPKGTKPEFEVKSAGAGRYYYVNKYDERCDIRELWRATDTNTWFRFACYVSGERNFGPFESLIYMTVQREEKATSGRAELYNGRARVAAWRSRAGHPALHARRRTLFPREDGGCEDHHHQRVSQFGHNANLTGLNDQTPNLPGAQNVSWKFWL